MTDFAELLSRIDRRLEAVGISERKACLSSGQKPDCIRTIRRGHPPTREKLRKLAKVLDCPLEYLEEAAPDIRLGNAGLVGAAPFVVSDDEAPPGYVYVPRLGVRMGLGAPGSLEDDPLDEPALLPERLIRTELRGQPTDFLSVEVEGPSMSPVLESGDQVLVDRRRTSPTQPGIFAIDEGIGLVAKWIEFVAHSEPPRLRVKSHNPIFEPYEVLAEHAKIIGRVVWYARRL